MKYLVIGGSTLGMMVRSIVERIAGAEFSGFIDDFPERLPESSKARWLGSIHYLNRETVAGKRILVAIGDNGNRKMVFQRLKDVGVGEGISTIIDPGATLMSNCDVAQGSILLPGAVVGPEAMIGEGVILNANCFVGALCRVGGFVNICPGASIGSASVLEEMVYVGMGAKILQGLHVSSCSVVGAGAVVVGDVVQSGVLLGVPAKPLMRAA